MSYLWVSKYKEWYDFKTQTLLYELIAFSCLRILFELLIYLISNESEIIQYTVYHILDYYRVQVLIYH